MLRRCYIADQIGSMPGRTGGADGCRYMVVAGSGISRKWAKDVIRRPPTHGFFQHNITFDFIKRHMPRTLDHHLTPHIPTQFSQFAINHHFGHLRPVMAVMDSPGPYAIAEREDGIIFFQQRTYSVKLFI